MPASLEERLKLVETTLESIRRAASIMHMVTPDYASQCRNSVRTVASVIATVQQHVRARADRVELVQETLPRAEYVGRYTGPGIRSLVSAVGHRKVFRQIRNGLWDLCERAQFLEQPAIEGTQGILADFMALAEDILYLCRTLHAPPGESSRARAIQTPEPSRARAIQTPETLD